MKSLSYKIKVLYGLGFAAVGIKDGLFQLFLFFYFSQVLGLDPALAGAASIISLFFDAISDPLVGMLSDRWTSAKWGRRHPFMFASAIPFGLSVYLLFLPPTGLEQMGLFLWLTLFSILVRLGLTLYQVPAMSLGAELTTDYEERTSVTSYRVMFSALVGPIIIIIGLLHFFTPTDEVVNGMFNVAAYSQFALFCGILIILFIVLSTYATRSVIPHLPVATHGHHSASLFGIFGKLKKAMKMQSYRTLVSYTMVLFVGIGVGTIFVPYFVTYFFGMSEKELALMPIAAGLGGVVAFIVAPMMGRLLDKKNAVIYSTVLLALFFSLPYVLRLASWFPDNGSDMLLPIFILLTMVGYIFIYVNLSIAHSMMAEVVDEYDQMTGEREEGFFFSTMSFAYKCTVGLGYFVAGILLKLIQFPTQTAVEDVSESAIYGLGVVGGPILCLIYLSSIFFILRYPISKSKYIEMREGIDHRNVNAVE